MENPHRAHSPWGFSIANPAERSFCSQGGSRLPHRRSLHAFGPPEGCRRISRTGTGHELAFGEAFWADSLVENSQWVEPERSRLVSDRSGRPEKCKIVVCSATPATTIISRQTKTTICIRHNLFKEIIKKRASNNNQYHSEKKRPYTMKPSINNFKKIFLHPFYTSPDNSSNPRYFPCNTQ